jgi:hypothetical protein
MLNTRFRIYCALSAILLAISACALPTASQTVPTPTKSVPSPTTEMSVVDQAATETALAASQASPTPEPPTDTPEPTATPTETPLPVGVIPTATPTLTPEPVIAEVMKETNCRSGPAGAYDLVTVFQTGTKLEVTARDLGGGFIVVRNPAKPEEECYVLANNVKVDGDASILPQYTPLASPTASPGFTATFKKFDDCKGDVFLLFDVINTGSVPFRSAYIKVTNLRTGESAEQALNAFDLWTGCIIARNVAPLDPGGSGWLASKTFLHDPRGNKLRAVIQACTEKNLKGTCVTYSVEIKP